MPAGKLESLSHASTPWRIGGAFAVVWASVLARGVLAGAAAGAMYLTVYPAVMLTSLVLGKGPGVASALFGIWLVERTVDGPLVSGSRLGRIGMVLLSALLLGWIAQKVRETQVALKHADERKNEFLAVLSHELRNPLAAMRNALQILEQPGADSHQVHRSHRIIGRQIGHLSRLVEDLLDVTRISRGKIHLQRSRIDLRELVVRTAEDHRGIAAARGVALEVETGPDPVIVDADATRMSQVLGNLVSNSLRFTDCGGRATVRLERRGSDAVVSVRDTGIGIAPDLLGRVFEPFTQADHSLHRTRGGLGLGLSLVKGLVELHRGRVEAKSEGVGRGAELVITIPAASGETARAQVGGRSARAVSSRRVLIVEDNVDAADTLQEILKMRGHQVVVARDGEQGIVQARSFRPHVVLCDIGLPGVDGYAVARQIRSDPAMAGAFLVALTGYALPDDQRRAHEAGFDRHVAKPVNEAQLEDALASAPSS